MAQPTNWAELNFTLHNEVPFMMFDPSKSEQPTTIEDINLLNLFL